MACKFIEEYHCIPPVKFEDLCRQVLPAKLADEIEELLIVKSKSSEKDLNPKLPVIQKYIEDEIIKYEQLLKSMRDDRIADWTILDEIFLEVLGR